MRFVIPSHTRPQEIQERTLATLDRCGIDRSKVTVFVADEEQVKHYLAEGKGENVELGGLGLTANRQAIRMHHDEGEHLVWLDDDVDDIVRLDYSEKKIESLRKGELSMLCRELFAVTRNARATLWGVYPTHNAFYMNQSTSFDLKFCSGPFFGTINSHDDKYALKLTDGPKEDYERTIRHYVADGHVVRANFLAPKTTYYTGSVHQNRLERENEAVASLIREFPQYVRRNPRRKSDYPEILLKKTGRNEGTVRL